MTTGITGLMCALELQLDLFRHTSAIANTFPVCLMTLLMFRI
ncbi:hypothetical protein KC19_VG308100 [Ceratodon purpureus]|uniref:Uncharacterized protein n=1 Tax=Ceratodon purpureus TaxID=3225 RepID=A0A8T0HX02_CERPU|nr:hypothetical protein KC19_VG308100 [Ceratodon purpureus]